jgi:hypothetical protein
MERYGLVSNSADTEVVVMLTEGIAHWWSDFNAEPTAG